MSYKKARGNARNRQKQAAPAPAEISAKDEKAISAVYTAFDNGRYTECLTACNNLRARLPTNPDVLAMKGAATYYLPVSNASTFFTAEELENVNIPTFLRAEGWRLIQEGISLAATSTQSYIPLHIASIVKRHEHREAEAISCLQQALTIAPSNSLFPKELAILYLHTGDYKKCEQSLWSFISAASTSKVTQTTRVFSVTSFLCNMLQGKLDQAELALTEFRGLLQKVASGAVSQGGSAHRDMSLYRSFYFEYVQALQAGHRILAEKVSAGSTASVGEFNLQVKEFSNQLKKVRSKKRYDRGELLRQSLVVYKDHGDMYLLTLRRLYCHSPFDLFVYEKIFELFLKYVTGKEYMVVLTGSASTADNVATKDEYRALYLAFSQFSTKNTTCSCTDRPLPACFFHIMEPIANPKQGRSHSENMFFNRTICMRLAYMALDHEALVSEIQGVLSLKCPPLGLLDYISDLIAALPHDQAMQIYDKLLADSYPPVNESYIQMYFGYALTCIQTDARTHDSNMARCISMLEANLMPLTPEEDANLPLIDCTQPLCILKDYLNDSASQESIEKFQKSHSQTLATLFNLLRFKDVDSLQKNPPRVELCELYTRILYAAGCARSAALMSALVSAIDNGDRSASRLSVEMHMKISAITEAYAMYGKFIYQSDPWLTSQDSQDISLLGLLYEEYCEPKALSRLISSTFFDGAADLTDESALKDVKQFAMRVRAALAALEFTFDSYHELIDFHHYVVRTGYPVTYWRALLEYAPLLIRQESTQAVITFVLELVLCLMKISDEQLEIFRKALLACSGPLADQYQERITYYNSLSKETKDARESEKNKAEGGDEQPDALYDKDPYLIHAFIELITNMRAGSPEDTWSYTPSMLAFKLWLLVEKVLQPSTGAVKRSDEAVKRINILRNILDGKILLALKDLKSAPIEVIADASALAHRGLSKVPAALAQASLNNLVSFLEGAATADGVSPESSSAIHRALGRLAEGRKPPQPQ